MRSLNRRSWGCTTPRWITPFYSLVSRAVDPIDRRIGTEGSVEVARGVLARDVRRHGSDNPVTVNRMIRLAERLRDAGQFDESIALLREAVGLLSEGLGADDVQTAIAESKLARSLRENKHG